MGESLVPARALSVVLIIALLVAGCGGDDDLDRGGASDDGGLAAGSSADASTDATASPMDAAGDAASRDGSAAAGPEAGVDSGGAGDAQASTFVQNFFTDGPLESVIHVGSSWYIGGAFSRISTHPTNDLVSLDATGTPAGCFRDPSFTGYEGGVMAQVGNSLYIGNWAASAPGVIKLDLTSCKVDSSFSTPGLSNVGVLVTDGTCLYTSYSPGGHQNESSSRLVKLDPHTGALDATFTPPGDYDGGISQLLFASGALYVAGGYSSGPGVFGTWHLTKLDPVTGSLDTTFNPGGAGFDQAIRALAASATSLYVGGQFSEYGNVKGSAAGLAKLDLTTGALDTSFGPPNTNLSGCGTTSNGVSYAGPCDPAIGLFPAVWTLAVSGSSLFVGGSFNELRGAPANNLAKLDLVTGALDTTFDPPASANNGFDYDVYALTPSGSNLYVGGFFTSYRGGVGNAFSFAKLDVETGAQDASFLPADSDVNGVGGNGPMVEQILVAGDDVILGGEFNTYGGHFTNGVAKLDDVTYAVDRTFQPFPVPYTGSGPAYGPEEYLWGGVSALTADARSLYIGGQFTGPMIGLAKVDLQTGAPDPIFQTPPLVYGYPSVQALALAGTSLYAYAPGQPTSASIFKVDSTSGAVDPAFGAPLDGGAQADLRGAVTSIIIAGDSLYAGGSFSDDLSATWAGVAKLSATTGALDTTFSPAEGGGFIQDGGTLSPSVNAVVMSGSSLYVGGSFTSYRGGSANNIAKLDAISGALDTTFSPPGANGFDQTVQALALGKEALYAAGAFTSYRGSISTPYLAKLDEATGAATPGYGASATQPRVPSVTTVAALGASDTGVLSSTTLGTSATINEFPFYSPLTPLAP